MNFESEWLEEHKQEKKEYCSKNQETLSPEELKENKKALSVFIFFVAFIAIYSCILFFTNIPIFEILFVLGVACAIFQFIVKPIFYALTYVVVKTEKIGWEMFKRL